MKKALIVFVLIILVAGAILILSVNNRPDTVNVSATTASETSGTSAQTVVKTAAVTSGGSRVEHQTGSPENEVYTDEQLSKMIAFTFDDGPIAKFTNRVLDAMEPYGYTATFFVIGRNIDEEGSKAMRRAVKMGCEIGNHTENHNLKFDSLEIQTRTAEIEESSAKIEKAAGVKPLLLRPPGGVCKNIRGNIDSPIILWSVDTNDWRKKANAGNEQAAQELAQYIMDEVKGKPGSIVLMHDVYQFSAETVEKVMPMLHEEGYIVKSVSSLAKAYGTALENGTVYRTIKR
ncbi:MAG: polysaccharide deacetylase family protein [Clostridiales bacterium]|nr:polysaccharide deacetylase family protein [Clostridiales bacterium]